VNHLCISVENREKLIKEVQDRGYETIIIERKQPDLVFIKDKSGNIFEIKQR
jgi:catechol 2,3-dioxygenase-like lactoylglutathione lyase family enzyme